MTLRGTPYVYEGQEIGMTNGDFENLDEVMDIESHNIYEMATNLHIPKSIRWKMIKRGSRDNARTPMQWSDEKNAGFSEVTPWLKVNGNYKEVNVRKEVNDPNGVFTFWQKMIKMRKTLDVLMDGKFKMLYEGKQIYAFKRELGTKRVVSVCNMSGKAAKLPNELLSWNKVIVSNYDDNDSVYLKPFEFRLLEK